MKYIIILIFVLSSLSAFAMAKRDLKFVPSKQIGDQIINRRFYQISYSNKHNQAEWVYYKLSNNLIRGKAKRSDHFVADPMVLKNAPRSDDYTNSGFDRGHLLPAADMKINQKAMQETFYMSNVSPQRPAFNRNLWKALEKKVRSFTEQKGVLFIITGPVLEKGLPTIKNDISIPELYYKVIVKKYSHKIETLAFLMPNQDSDKPLKDFIVSIDEIEQVTGLDLLKGLENDLENEIESNLYNGVWNI